MRAPRRWSGVLFLLGLHACAGNEGAWPRPTAPEDLDALVLERVEAALAACARDERGSGLELGKVYDANGMRELALATYDRCLETGHDSPSVLHYLRGAVLQALERPEEALAAFQEALQLGDSYAPTRWRSGEILLELGRLKEARAEFEAALALEPRSVPATLGLARTLLLEGDAAVAEARLRPLSEANPGERFVHGLLARVLRALGREEEAQRALLREERASQVSVSDPRLAEVQTRATGLLNGLARANEALARGDARQAIALLTELHARLPSNLAVQQLYAKALLAAKQPAQALELLARSAAAHPDEFKTELFLGLAQRDLKALGKAHAHLLRAAELNPAYGPTHAALGEVELLRGRFAPAEAALSLAQECGEDDLRTRILLVQSQLEQRAFSRAAATAEEVRAAFPNAVAAWSYLAEARARLGETEAARQALAEAEKRNPDYERLAHVRSLLTPP
jgi:tetratricopeptide (TPR) repeat protein